MEHTRRLLFTGTWELPSDGNWQRLCDDTRQPPFDGTWQLLPNGTWQRLPDELRQTPSDGIDQPPTDGFHQIPSNGTRNPPSDGICRPLRSIAPKPMSDRRRSTEKPWSLKEYIHLRSQSNGRGIRKRPLLEPRLQRAVGRCPAHRQQRIESTSFHAEQHAHSVDTGVLFPVGSKSMGPLHQHLQFLEEYYAHETQPNDRIEAVLAEFLRVPLIDLNVSRSQA